MGQDIYSPDNYLFLHKFLLMKQSSINLFLAVILILAAAIFKVITYPNSYDPIIAMALFGGAVIKDKRFAFVLPLFAMFLSDFLLEISRIERGFYGWGQLPNYIILAIITIFGFRLKKINVINVIGFSLGASVIFYLLSNLSYFFIDNRIYHTYTNDVKGFLNNYYSALPFMKAHVDLLFSIILFGVYYLVTAYAANKKRIAA